MKLPGVRLSAPGRYRSPVYKAVSTQVTLVINPLVTNHKSRARGYPPTVRALLPLASAASLLLSARKPGDIDCLLYMAGAQRQMRAVSRCQLTYDVEYRPYYIEKGF